MCLLTAAGCASTAEVAETDEVPQETDTDDIPQAQMPDLRFVYWERQGDDEVVATLVEVLDGVPHPRTLGTDVYDGAERWIRFRGRTEATDRWILTRTQGADGTIGVRVFDLEAPLSEAQPVQVGAIEPRSGFSTLVGDDTLLVGDGPGYADLGLVSLGTSFEVRPTGGRSAPGSALPAGDGEHFFYFGGPEEGHELMLDDFDPTTPPRAVTELDEDDRVVAVWDSPDHTWMLVGVGLVYGSERVKKLYMLSREGADVSPAIQLGEVNGTGLHIIDVAISNDGERYTLSIGDGTTSPEIIETRIASFASGAEHRVDVGEYGGVRFLPDDTGYLYWRRSSAAEPGVFLAGNDGAVVRTFFEGEVRDAELCGELVVATVHVEERDEVRVFTLGGDSVPLTLGGTWEAGTPSISCQANHVLLDNWERYELLVLDGEQIVSTASVDLTPSRRFVHRSHFVALSPNGSTLRLWTGSDPAAQVVAEGRILGFEVLD